MKTYIRCKQDKIQHQISFSIRTTNTLALICPVTVAGIRISVISFKDSDSVMVRASASVAGGRGFDPGPGHTKDFKNGTSGYLAWCSAL